MLRLLENVKNLKVDIFTYVPRQNFPPDSYHHPQSAGNYLFPPGGIFFGNLFPQQKEMGRGGRGETMPSLLSLKPQKKFFLNKIMCVNIKPLCCCHFMIKKCRKVPYTDFSSNLKNFTLTKLHFNFTLAKQNFPHESQ